MPDTIVAPAPAAPAPPAPPAAPDRLTVLKEARYDPALVFEETIKASMPATEAPAPLADKAPPPLPQRDPTTGKFVKAESGDGQPPTDVPQPSAPITEPGKEAPPAEGEPPAEEAPAEVPIPEGYAAPPTLPEDRARGFKVRDKDGELEPPDLTWEIATASGARQFSTDQLINLARDGAYNHQLFQQNQEYLETINRDRADFNELREFAEGLDGRLNLLLSSEDAYLNARAEWAAQNTPEALLERERGERRQAEQRVELVQLQAAGNQYYENQIAPAFKQIVQALPNVTLDEIGMRFLLVTDHLRVPTEVGNIFPASAYEQVERAITRDVVDWAKALHAQRERVIQPTREAEQKAAAKARQEVEAARVRAQKARRVATAATKPLGGNGAVQRGNAAPPPNGKVLAHKDAEAAVIGSTLAQMRGQ